MANFCFTSFESAFVVLFVGDKKTDGLFVVLKEPKNGTEFAALYDAENVGLKSHLNAYRLKFKDTDAAKDAKAKIKSEPSTQLVRFVGVPLPPRPVVLDTEFKSVSSVSNLGSLNPVFIFANFSGTPGNVPTITGSCASSPSR